MTDSDPTRHPTRTRRWWLFAVAGVLLVWIVVATLIVPALIRAAYEQRAFELLNELISGRAEHPVDEYLADWWALALRLTLALGAFVLLVFTARHWRHRLLPALRRALLGGSGRSLGAGDVVLLCVGLSAATGLLEALGVLLHQWVAPKPHWMYRSDVFWAAPAVNAVVTLVLTAPVVLMAAVRRRRVPLRPIAFMVAGLGAYGALRGWAIGVLPYAAVVVSLAIASFAVGRLERIPTAVARLALGAFVLVAAGGAVVIPLSHRPSRSSSGTEAVDGRPNLLLLILDTVRAREMSLYGYPIRTTPRIDEFAEGGTVFDHAIAPSSWTLPSHSSLFTGVPATKLSADWDVVLDDHWPTLAEVLNADGYETAGFVANFDYTGRASGIGRGFDAYVDHLHRVEFAIRNSELGRTSYGWLQRLRARHQDLDRLDAADINNAFLDWVLPGRGRPFFAFLNYYDAHDPYLPPHAPKWWSTPDPPLYYFAGPEHSQEQIRELQNAYDEAIRYLDGQVGSLLDSLQATGILDNTLVVIAADHGELFGEHDPRLLSHGNSLYHAVLNVPLIIVPPGARNVRGRVTQTVGLTDLSTTLLDLLGSARSLPGNSFAAHVTSTPMEPADEPRAILSEVRPNRSPQPWEPIALGPLVSVVQDSFQYIRNGDGSEELYNLAVDPWEKASLADKARYAADLARLRTVADSMLE